MPQLTWVVTGCSAGFGEQFVSSIVARGDRVVATARNAPHSIRHLEGPNVALLELDITAPQAELDAKIKEALNFFGGADVLVNNAGQVRCGILEEVSGERFMAVYENNVIGAINLTRSILPHFREKGAGVLAFIGSMGGWQGGMSSSPYCATKFALEAVVDSLQEELKPFGIKSIIFEPGYFPTKILDKGRLKYEFDPIDAYARMREEAQSSIEVSRASRQGGDVKKAVELMIDVVKGEGVSGGKEMPKRLPLGSDAFARIESKCRETLKICDEWEGVIKSSDVEK